LRKLFEVYCVDVSFEPIQVVQCKTMMVCNFAMLYVKTMVCGVAINSVEIT